MIYYMRIPEQMHFQAILIASKTYCASLQVPLVMFYTQYRKLKKSL